MTSARTPQLDCTAFEARLGEYLEGALDDGERARMDAHRAGCASCAALVADLHALVAKAGALPPLVPSRDLWPGIEARIITPVVSLEGRSARSMSRVVSVRTFAAAALLLVVASSGITWMVARARAPQAPPVLGVVPQSVAPPTIAPLPTALTPGAAGTASRAPVASSVSTPVREPASLAASSRSRLASRGNDDAGLIYEREIRAMRRIVDERLGDLDSTTVVEVERNLAIIDRAIDDSRRALARDPRSRFLSTQLDRALENKLAIMRRVALL